MCFKSLRDEAPVASWRNGLYGCILRTQRSRGTIWNRRRGAVCRVFQKSSWRSSRRFVGNLTIWMYIVDAALRWTFLIRWRRAACCVFQKSSWRSSRRFVEKWSIWVYIGDAALRCAFWSRRRDTACCMFQNSSWRSSRRFVEKWSIWVYIGDAALRYTFLNRRRYSACCMFQNSSWRSYQRFVDEVPHISRKWWYNKCFETVGHLMDFRCRRMFQNCVHVAPGVAWRSVKWSLLKRRAYHSVPCVSKRSVTMRRELRDEAMNWVLLKHTAPHMAHLTRYVFCLK